MLIPAPNMKLSILLLTLALAGGTALAKGPKAKAKAVKQPTYETWSYTDEDLYPGAIISAATVDWNTDEEDEEAEIGTYGDENGWLGIVLYDAPKGAKVTVEISADGGWMKPSTLSIVTEDNDDEVLIIPKGVFDYDALRQVKQQKPVNVTTKVTINGIALEETTETHLLRSVNECPFAVYYGDDEEPDDISYLFAGYVNENHPWIDGLLKEALATGIVDSFDGYQSGDRDKVLAQVFAIWHVLEKRGLKYSDITATPPSKTVASQYVRFLDDSIENKQANCVDGTVLMASILTKISLNAHLVLVPGHCYLAFDLKEDDETGRSTVALETTMLGTKDVDPLDSLTKLSVKSRAKLNAIAKSRKVSVLSFANAFEVGTSDYKENAAEFEEDGDPDYVRVSISDARDLGIMPISAGRN